MKNTFLLLLLMSSILISCKKESIVEMENFPFKKFNKSSERVSVIDGRLVFEDSLTFSDIVTKQFLITESEDIDQEGYLDAWEDSLNFTSLRRQFIEAGDTILSDLFHPYLSTVLNKDSIIQIGNRIYMISMSTEKIYIIPDGDDGKIPYFAYMEHIPDVIIEMPTEMEEAFYVDYENYDEILAKRSDCANAPGKTDQVVPRIHYFYDNTEYRFSGYLKYMKAGVFFTLFTKIEHHKKGKFGWTGHKVILSITDNVVYDNICTSNSAEFKYKAGTTQKFDDDHNSTRYLSTNALKKYRASSSACFVKVGAVATPPLYTYPLTCFYRDLYIAEVL